MCLGGTALRDLVICSGRLNCSLCRRGITRPLNSISGSCLDAGYTRPKQVVFHCRGS